MTSVFTTARDVELLTALVMGPLTTAQLFKLSETFAAGPFGSPRTLLDRLQRLARGGFVHRYPLAILPARGGGLPHYYKLTPAGLRLLYGEDARPPTRQFFAPVAVARHHHTHALSEFLVTTAVAAHRRGLRLVDLHPENTLVLDVQGETLLPDARFDVRTPSGRLYRFLVEIDGSTETIRSRRHDETVERKLRLHDAFQDEHRERHRVLFVTSRSRERGEHILSAAAGIVRNPERTLFLAAYLGDFLAAADPCGEPLFLDHRSRRCALLPERPDL